MNHLNRVSEKSKSRRRLVMTREEAERHVRAAIAEVNPTQVVEVAGWLAEHCCPVDLQKICSLANARCARGHTQYENCHGVLVNAVVQLTADQWEAADETISPTKNTEPGPIITNPGQLIPAAADRLVVPGEVSPTGLQLRDGLSFAEWKALGSRLREVKDNLLWWLGDWLAYGERHYGETYDAARAATRYKIGTLRNAKYVAQRIDPSRRRDNLSWSHHYEVAALEPAEADRWLDRAVAEHWSQKRLRAEIAAAATPRLIEQDADAAPRPVRVVGGPGAAPSAVPSHDCIQEQGGRVMSKKCKHEANWRSTSVVSRDDEFCSVGLVCLHCDECAFADLGPEAFRWSEDYSPVASGGKGGGEDPPPSDDAA